MYFIKFLNFSLENERGRQEQLARERIAALKRKREQQHQQNNAEQTEAEKLEAEEELDKKDDLSAVEQMQREGTVALQDAVLDEMDKKHTSEQDVRQTFFSFLPENLTVD